MTSFLHNTQVRERLRKLRPFYNAIFRRKRDYTRLPTPVDHLRSLQGRGVFLLCYGRSGSTVFADFLASHPDVVTFGEVLGENSFYSYFQWLSRSVLWRWSLRPTLMAQEFYRYCARLVATKPAMQCLFDLKIESLHLIEGNWRMPGPGFAIFDHLKAAGAPVILLTRQDLVARYVSGQVAEKRGAYHSYHGDTANPAPFEIDLNAIDAQIDEIEASYAKVREVFAGTPQFLELSYENLFMPDPVTGETHFTRELSAQIAALLGVDDQFDRVPRLQRVSKEAGYGSLITNWTAVEAYRTKLYARA
ncbi:MAG: hypothetical protein AAF280_00950 [Pseudomonadota bacterium]